MCKNDNDKGQDQKMGVNRQTWGIEDWIQCYDNYPGRFEEDYETWKMYVADMCDIQHMQLEIRYAKCQMHRNVNVLLNSPDQLSYLWEHNGNCRYIADRYYEIARILDDFDEKYPAHIKTLGEHLDEMQVNLFGMGLRECEQAIFKWEAPKL